MLPLYVTLSYADLSVKQIENMIHKIHLKREVIELKTLDQTKEPFVQVKKEDNITVVVKPKIKKKDVKLSLHAIVANKAYINNGWKKVGDVILGYKVEYIGKRGVVLRSGNSIRKLFLGKPKSDLIILEERE
jgi:hypothetical protein